jgi:hypothetical protein
MSLRHPYGTLDRESWQGFSGAYRKDGQDRALFLAHNHWCSRTTMRGRLPAEQPDRYGMIATAPGPFPTLIALPALSGATA